jgi:hypothetical protein
VEIFSEPNALVYHFSKHKKFEIYGSSGFQDIGFACGKKKFEWGEGEVSIMLRMER